MFKFEVYWQSAAATALWISALSATDNLTATDIAVQILRLPFLQGQAKTLAFAPRHGYIAAPSRVLRIAKRDNDHPSHTAQIKL